MKRTLSLLLCLGMLAGCGTPPEPTAPSLPADTQPTTQAATQVPETQPTTQPPTTDAPEEVPGPLRHPLTGQLLEQPLLTRPTAVVINNISAAQPLLGIGGADILFEHVVEGGGSVTRMLAVYTDLENAGKLGSIRSARTYLLDLAWNFDAPLVHCGQSIHARIFLETWGYPSYNQFVYPKYFYRDPQRLSAGYALEHTMLIDGRDLAKGLAENGFDMTLPQQAYYGMDFSEEATPEGENAHEITLRFYRPGGKATVLRYDEEQDAYFGTQKWTGREAPIADGNTGKDVAFRNVLILKAETYSDGYHEFATLHGEGEGYFACGGSFVPIRWSRPTTSESYTYTLTDGTPLVFGVGKTYVGVIPTQSPQVLFS